MKFIGLSCVIVGLAVAGCDRPTAQDGDTSAAPNIAGVPAPTVPPTPQYAPPGVFYVLESVRIETKDGISRLTPGTEVKLLRPGMYRTPIGDIPLNPKVLTNDLTQARTAQTVDGAKQSAAYARIPAATPYLASSAPAPSRVISAPVRPTTDASASDENLRSLRFKLSVYQKEEGEIQKRIDYLTNKAAERSQRTTVYTNAYTNQTMVSINGTAANSEIDEANHRLAFVRSEVKELQRQLNTQTGTGQTSSAGH